MTIDLATLINNLQQDGTLRSIVNNQFAQFGLPTQPNLGATLLPEKSVPENAYREENIRYRTIIANNGSRYSPVQRKKGVLMGAFDVSLSNSDLGSEFTGRDYDTLLRLLGTGSTMEGVIQITKWAEAFFNRGMIALNEKQRWEAILNAEVVATGDNGWSETITYANPSGHRVNAATQWSDDAVDPMNDIGAIVDLLYTKGYTVTRIITNRPVISILNKNAKMRSRAGLNVINATTGLLNTAPGRIDHARLNAIFAADNLPPIEEYNALYRTSTGTAAYIPGNTMVFACATGRDEALLLDNSDTYKEITDTLGYLAVGRAVGESSPGRVLRLFPEVDKPPRIDGQSWQTTIPVITEPEAFAVIKNIH